MEIVILAIGCAIPALLYAFATRPKRWETEREWDNRVSPMSFRGNNRRQRVPEHGYEKRAPKRRKRTRR